MRTRIKLFGERNTGTNYITKFLMNNFSIKVLSDGPPYWWEKRFGLGNWSMTGYFLLTSWSNLGWKHAVPKLKQSQTNNCVFVIVTKNPYSWLLSLHKRPYHNEQAADLSFAEFLSTPWPLLSCEGINGLDLTPIDLWNIKNNAYLQLSGETSSSIVVRYEDILSNPRKFLDDFSRVAKIPITGELAMVNEGAKSKDTNRSFDEYKNYYLNEIWREKLTTDNIKNINQFLDESLMTRLGYSMI